MFYLIQDAHAEHDPAYKGWLAERVWVGFTWTRKRENAKKFTDLMEVSKVAKALLGQNQQVRIVEVTS
jgi:hypothetical protein